jgi:hypothetical protein
MAAWTQAELDQVRAAVVALAAGKRAASVSFAGPPARTVSYVAAQLGELRSLLSEMEASVSKRRRFRRVAHSKGFYPRRGS